MPNDSQGVARGALRARPGWSSGDSEGLEVWRVWVCVGVAGVRGGQGGVGLAPTLEISPTRAMSAWHSLGLDFTPKIDTPAAWRSTSDF